MKFPDSRFNFGDIVLLQMPDRVNEHEPCDECFNGVLKVMGPKGDAKDVTCKKCSGSGKKFEVLSYTTTKRIDGMLKISSIRCEYSENVRRGWGGFEGIHYSGHVVWREDLDKEDTRANCFREENLLSISESASWVQPTPITRVRGYCQCEHAKHENDPWHTKNERNFVHPVKLIYGTYNLCQECEEDCHKGDD